MVYYGENVEVFKTKYLNGNLALIMTSADGYWTISVNITKLPDPDLCFLDVNNNPDIMQFIEDNNIGRPLGYWEGSGFVKYPLFEIDIEKLKDRRF